MSVPGGAAATALATVGEVAAFLRVPPKTLYRWRYAGEGPPAYRVGRHLRFRWGDVEAWLEDRGKAPENPPGTRKKCHHSRAESRARKAGAHPNTAGSGEGR